MNVDSSAISLGVAGGNANGQDGGKQPVYSSPGSIAGREVCSICLDPLKPPVVELGCAHKLHYLCLRKLSQFAQDVVQCPLCRQVATGVLSNSLTPPQIPSLFPSLYNAPPQFEFLEEPAVQRQPFTDDEAFPALAQLPPRSPLVLECIAGFTQENFDGRNTFFDGLIRLAAPEEHLEGIAPADFVVVADVSGSMNGHKIEQLKNTMHWLIDNLTERHRMCIITFNNQADRNTPLTVMNAAGKVKLLAAVHGIAASGGTNITLALDLAAAVLDERVHKDAATICVLLTDGQDSAARAGSKQAIASIAKKALLACVGLGEDHDAKLLSELSHQAHGTFEYCPDADAIAPTIGGLKGAATTAAAMGLKLWIQGDGPSYDHEISLFSEGQEQLFPFTACTSSAPYLKAQVTYTAPGTNHETVQTLECNMQDANKKVADHATLVRIDAQKNRLQAGQSLLQSADMAAAGNYEGARALLKDAIQVMQRSISAKDPLSVKLIDDCTKALENLENSEAYEQQGGAAQAYTIGSSHSQQTPSARGGNLYGSATIFSSSQSARLAVSRKKSKK